MRFSHKKKYYMLKIKKQRKTIMKYSNIVSGKFINRPNRFIAEVEIDGKVEVVHVKNTGRCREILLPDAEVYLQHVESPTRKTKYSLISARKGQMLINIDSQVPNQVVYEAILNHEVDILNNHVFLKREVTYSHSRFDLYFETEKDKGFVEVKGVTLEKDGIALFPDAPTERGTRHIMELIEAVKEGYKGYLFLLIQMKGCHSFRPNHITDPKFSEALKLASDSGIEIVAYDCDVTEDSIEISEKTPISI